MPQTVCFLVRLGKPYGPAARGNSIRNHSRIRAWCILATWTQELVSVSYVFRKVHMGPCGRTGLGTPT